MCCGASSFVLNFIRDRQLFEELERMVDEDTRLHSQLAASGEIFEGNHPALAPLHQRNAKRLREIIAEKGWPGHSLVGHEGATYAWMIAQHAVGDPEFQRCALDLLKQAAAKGEAPASHVARLEERVRAVETKL